MELNVGDYVRTKYGEICKLKKSKYKYLLYETDIEIDRHNDRDCNDYGFDEDIIKDIIKSSPNIIDLIEVGDYVNGDRVKALKGDIENHKINNEEDVIYTEYINDYDEWCGYEEDEIKSIVTKEQFESMEYKL